MNYLKKYAIPLSGLDHGQHIFNFVADAEFFEEFESSDLIDGRIDVSITLHKNTGFFNLQIKLKGSLVVPCDRCLEEFEQAVENEGNIYVKVDNNEDFEDHDIFVISTSADEIDVAQLIFDYVNLGIPSRCIHPKDKYGKNTCNTEMIKKLEKYTIEDDVDHVTDPRWDKLKNLLN